MHGGTSISPVQIYKDLYELKVNKQRLNGMIRIKDSGIVGLILANYLMLNYFLKMTTLCRTVGAFFEVHQLLFGRYCRPYNVTISLKRGPALSAQKSALLKVDPLKYAIFFSSQNQK